MNKSNSKVKITFHGHYDREKTASVIAGKRLGEVPQFAAYAIADGIKRAFAVSRAGLSNKSRKV